MKASSPQDLSRLIVEALNSGDVELIVSLYESDAVITPSPSQTVAGRDAIRLLASGFVAQHPRLALEDSEIVQAGDIAIIRSRVKPAKVQDADEKESILDAIIVARRQIDGCWLIVIDRPRAAG